jgi:hypothetical protein
MSYSGKFNFSRRAVVVGTFNNRFENHGDDRVKAIDLPLEFPISISEIDMVCPAQGVKLSEFLYGVRPKGARGWKPVRQTHLLSPVRVHRKPEHIELTFYVSKFVKKGRAFFDVSIKDPVIELLETEAFVTCKAQLHPANGAELAWVAESLEGQEVQFECHSTQPELFDEPEEPAAAGTQAELIEEGADDDEGED